MSFLQEIPFPGAVAILAVGTVAGVYASARTGDWLWLVVAVVAVGVVAVLYLREYAKLPGPEWATDAPASPTAPPTAPAPSTTTSEPGAETVPAPADQAPSGPVEVDKFDPEYDPVAEADEIESHSTHQTPPPEA